MRNESSCFTISCLPNLVTWIKYARTAEKYQKAVGDSVLFKTGIKFCSLSAWGKQLKSTVLFFSSLLGSNWMFVYRDKISILSPSSAQVSLKILKIMQPYVDCVVHLQYIWSLTCLIWDIHIVQFILFCSVYNMIRLSCSLHVPYFRNYPQDFQWWIKKMFSFMMIVIKRRKNYVVTQVLSSFMEDRVGVFG